MMLINCNENIALALINTYVICSITNRSDVYLIIKIYVVKFVSYL